MNDHEPQIIIGERHGWDKSQPFGISQVDQRQHIYIIGKTGSGKTTLLRNLIVQHIALGHGVGLIDPHGDLAEEVLNHIPSSRADHVVYFNPGDLEFPVGLNLLANVSSDKRHLVASGVVSAFKGIWRDSWGPRPAYATIRPSGLWMGMAIRSAMMPLAHNPNAKFHDGFRCKTALLKIWMMRIELIQTELEGRIRRGLLLLGNRLICYWLGFWNLVLLWAFASVALIRAGRHGPRDRGETTRWP
ncbi:MAG: DUF87 domain-containing protein [Candidatus Moraniibacteriota bacterium]